MVTWGVHYTVLAAGRLGSSSCIFLCFINTLRIMIVSNVDGQLFVVDMHVAERDDLLGGAGGADQVHIKDAGLAPAIVDVT